MGRGWVCERDMARVRVCHGIAGQNYCVIVGCLLSLSLCRKGFQNLLKVRPPSLLLAQAIFEPNLLPLTTPTILKFSHSTPTCLWRWNRQSVPKRRHIKFRLRGITQKKNIQHTEHGESLKSRSLRFSLATILHSLVVYSKDPRLNLGVCSLCCYQSL